MRHARCQHRPWRKCRYGRWRRQQRRGDELCSASVNVQRLRRNSRLQCSRHEPLRQLATRRGARAPANTLGTVGQTKIHVAVPFCVAIRRRSRARSSALVCAHSSVRRSTRAPDHPFWIACRTGSGPPLHRQSHLKSWNKTPCTWPRWAGGHVAKVGRWWTAGASSATTHVLDSPES